MDLNNYDDLIDKAYENIPENVKKLSRFEIPKVQIRNEAKNTYITNFNRIINILNRDRKHFI
ncbi:MAG: translation initiation factor IF-2 subunit beta, partial [Candidatus Lokiarchaeota archaeon]|nr:translation initiation factor IF-2 subunit beta [Candidatus Lokiarchaeota archaeon]